MHGLVRLSAWDVSSDALPRRIGLGHMLWPEAGHPWWLPRGGVKQDSGPRVVPLIGLPEGCEG